MFQRDVVQQCETLLPALGGVSMVHFCPTYTGSVLNSTVTVYTLCVYVCAVQTTPHDAPVSYNSSSMPIHCINFTKHVNYVVFALAMQATGLCRILELENRAD